MPVIKRTYKVTKLSFEGVEIPVLKLVSSEEVPKSELKKAVEQMELSDYVKDTFVEYVIREGNITYRKAIGKGPAGELSKWPVKLRRVAVLRHSPENLDLNKLNWHEVEEDVYVYEGKVEGVKAILLDTEEGMYLVLNEALESEEESRQGEESGS
ncbi:hypothetical protein IPA_00955 [Ignicoccus pacificus DSM 13166]|uniref:Uncharacterized protein n=1 Tax=Ignicoccus pacificus DSM 13166 TaxID=940294 RepID=A0A977PKH5_9CREN|nr:hypothetical protein IPA_00955 [Ignicoccus pacificus DSM 13166]